MKKIGLTGGFGSGKTTVTAIFRKCKVPVIDADEIARQVVKANSVTARRLRRAFGATFFDSRGALKRDKLATYVFENKSRLKKLNALTHPAILREINCQLKKYRKKKVPFVVIDAALLYEVGMEKEMDEVIVVWAPQTTRLERLARYRHTPKREAQRRIDQQWPLRKKRIWADYVIDNSEGRAATRRQTLKLIRNLC